MTKLVSVIITTCKGDKRLVRAINSILQQTYDCLEIILVDDNGCLTREQKKTEQLIAEFLPLKNFSYIKHLNNMNGAVARNTGIKVSKGEYLTFLDDDDFFLEDRLSTLVNSLENEPEFDAAYSNVVFIRGNSIDNIYELSEEGHLQKSLLLNQSLLGTGSNIFIRRGVVKNLVGFDESFNRYQDVEFMIRVLGKFKMKKIEEFLVVKDITDSRFYPEFNSFRLAQNHFIQKFDYLIQELSFKEYKDFILAKRSELIYSSYISNDRKNVKIAYDLLKEDLPNISRREVLKIKLKAIKNSGNSNEIVEGIRKYIRNTRRRNLEKQLPKLLIERINIRMDNL